MKQTGRLGEQLAARYLRKHGYQIIQTNAYARVGEVDIIAEKSGVRHFVEVKTTTGGRRPAEALTKEKRRRLRASAIRLSHQLPEAARTCCCLISVEVHPTSREVTVEHVHDQF